MTLFVDMAWNLPLNCCSYLCLTFLISSCFCFTLEPVTLNNSTEGYDLCLEFTELENGNVTLIQSEKRRELHLSCVAGFILVGEPVINCDNDFWPKPFCVHEGCEEPAMLANGEVRVEGYKEDQQYYAEGVTLEYKCMKGFHLSTQVKSRVCEKGKWSGHDPSCEPDGCAKPSLLVNGLFVPDYDLSHYPVGSYVHFTCEIGFQLQGVSRVQCVANGEWSHTLPQCLRTVQNEGLSCPPPPLGPHVVVTAVRGLQSANSAISGTTLEASCETGYRDQVSPCVPSLLRCIDGNWQGHFANCVSVDTCMYPLNIPHATMLRVGLQSPVGVVEYPLGSRVAYTCHPDYQLVGDAILTCQPDGCWDPYIFPVCHPRHKIAHTFEESSRMWDADVKLNTTLLVSMIAMASVSVILLSVCLVVLCRPHPAPTPPVNVAPPPTTDPDRVALIAFADGVQNCGQSVLPSYEEAVRGSLGGVLNYRLHRPHWTTMLGGQRRGNRDNNRQTPSMRDSMGSTDTVTVSEVSTNVTVDTVSSHSGSQTASCHAICGSLASFDTSSVLNTDGVPLLEVNELEEVTSNSQSNGAVPEPDFKLQSDIASIHS